MDGAMSFKMVTGIGVINGVIYTGDRRSRAVEAIASTRRDRLLHRNYGGDSDADAKTRVIDLKGGFAMPGFNDAHLGIWKRGASEVTGSWKERK